MNVHPGMRQRKMRRHMLLALALVLLLMAGSLGAALAADQTYYLRGTGVPFSSLNTTYPTQTDLPNFDPGRDAEPGLLLQESGNEHFETDPTKYQLWMSAPMAADLNGNVSLTFWSAMKDFAPNKKGSVRVQLLDCDAFLLSCTVITAMTRTADPWSGGATDWVQHTIDFGDVTHDFSFSRSLAVKLVVRSQSDDVMWFAYDTTSYPSSLTIGTEPPVTTTTTTTTTTTVPPTTTTTTTTTLAPTTTTTTTTTPTTTTTTAPPTTTTTTGPLATTTTVPGYGPTTTQPPINSTTTTTPILVFGTTTTQPPAMTTSTTTTTAVATTTPTGTTLPQASTTTIQPAPDEPSSATDPATATQDIALAALPESDDSDRGGGRPGGAFSSALIDGLALVVPPAVAAALLSPLMLLEALLAVFATTGRELLIPLVILFAGVAWAGGRRRRQDNPRNPLLEQRSQP